jgi:hypothetical protein
VPDPRELLETCTVVFSSEKTIFIAEPEASAALLSSLSRNAPLLRAFGNCPSRRLPPEVPSAEEGERMSSPTGKRITITGMTFSRLEGGKIVEEFQNWDTFGMMQQLGAVHAAALV